MHLNSQYTLHISTFNNKYIIPNNNMKHVTIIIIYLSSLFITGAAPETWGGRLKS